MNVTRKILEEFVAYNFSETKKYDTFFKVIANIKRISFDNSLGTVYACIECGRYIEYFLKELELFSCPDRGIYYSKDLSNFNHRWGAETGLALISPGMSLTIDKQIELI